MIMILGINESNICGFVPSVILMIMIYTNDIY